MIRDCSELKSVVIGEESFFSDEDRGNGKGQLMIHNCGKLEMIEIGNISFGRYSKKFELRSDILLLW